MPMRTNTPRASPAPREDRHAQRSSHGNVLSGLGNLVKSALLALGVGAAHFAAHSAFGMSEAFAAAGVLPAGISASLAALIGALVLF